MSVHDLRIGNSAKSAGIKSASYDIRPKTSRTLPTVW